MRVTNKYSCFLKQNMNTTKLIRPMIVNGSLIYNESSRACSIIRLKRTVLEEFPQLKSKDNCFYQLEFWKDYATTLQRITEAQENEEGIPLLLWIRKEVTHE